ncbi:MAG: hypothetical protein CMI18_06660 [Opitutaceae bacterium]|nr:hypothetical protein [Opitutaceae bacterium]
MLRKLRLTIPYIVSLSVPFIGQNAATAQGRGCIGGAIADDYDFQVLACLLKDTFDRLHQKNPSHCKREQ